MYFCIVNFILILYNIYINMRVCNSSSNSNGNSNNSNTQGIFFAFRFLLLLLLLLQMDWQSVALHLINSIDTINMCVRSVHRLHIMDRVYSVQSLAYDVYVVNNRIFMIFINALHGCCFFLINLFNIVGFDADSFLNYKMFMLCACNTSRSAD